MPKIDIDYTKTIIYVIQHKERKELLYVGHTTNITNRTYTHKARCKSNPDKLYEMIRENGGWEMFDMKPVKQISCSGSTEARIEEEKCRCEYQATMNTIRAIRTPENAEEVALQKKATKRKYELDNKDKIKAEKKKYYKDNQEMFKAKAKDHYEQNKDDINERRKREYNENKDVILIQQKQWYEANKDARHESNKIKFICVCGAESTRCNKLRHEKSKVHKAYLDALI